MLTVLSLCVPAGHAGYVGTNVSLVDYGLRDPRWFGRLNVGRRFGGSILVGPVGGARR